MAFQKFKVDNIHPHALQQIKDVLNGVSPSLAKAGGKIPDVSGFTKGALDQVVSACENRAMVAVPETDFYMTDTQVAIFESVYGGKFMGNIFPTLGTYDTETRKFTGLVMDVPLIEGMIPGVPSMILTVPVALFNTAWNEETSSTEVYYAGVSSDYVKYLQSCMLDVRNYNEKVADIYYGEADMTAFYTLFGEFTNIKQFSVNVSAAASVMSFYSGYSTATEDWAIPLLVGSNEPVVVGVGIPEGDDDPSIVAPVWTTEGGREGYAVVFSNDEKLVCLSNTYPNMLCVGACFSIDYNYLATYLLRHAILCINAASNVGSNIFTCYKHDDGTHGWSNVMIVVTAPSPSAE